MDIRTVLGREPAMLIGDSWVTAEDSRPVINPADESTIAEVPEADANHVELALEAARTAQRAWARKTGPERGAVLRAVAEAIRERKEELARLVVAEQGKTITEARGEVGDAAAGFFDYYSTFERAQVGTMFAPDEPNEHLLVRSVPYGVVVGIIPWNYPAALFARKVAPAIMAGNAIVLKPHEDTPLSALALAGVLEEAGVPPGVVNVVTGAGRTVGDALVRNPITRMVSMTGSVRGGREILAAAAENITPVSLELGGKAPFIVLEDADVRSAVENAVDARFWNCGQVCTCNERTYVQRAVYDEFVERFVEAASALRMGDPTRDDVQMGPKVNRPELEKVEALVQGAVEQGAEVVLGGGRPQGEEFERGYWFEPTVITGTTNDMEIVQREVFGPVLPIQPFDDFDEVVGLANDSPYGLSAYVFTSDLHRAMRAIDDIDFGEIYVNKIGPEQLQGFHTGYRLSGMGGDDGPYGYERYLRRKTVYLHYEGFGTPAELHP
ncbi:MAG TPA: aldehyde dehydrogenase [Rubrobacteraceae bacterium]|nr:aldehyde dehydrogenase [Rubrobacteraceae bacterium]